MAARILVIEDNAPNLQLMTYLLKAYGHTVLTAADGGATLLVVDNSAVNIQLVRSTFEPLGYEIIAASNVEEGVALAQRLQPDLILSDVPMPARDGYAFLQAVKANPQLQSIPFVFLSSTIWGTQDRATGLALGASKFITRPIEPLALVAEVEGCLQQRHQAEKQYGNHPDRG